MTYNVFGETLNLAQSIMSSVCEHRIVQQNAALRQCLSLGLVYSPGERRSRSDRKLPTSQSERQTGVCRWQRDPGNKQTVARRIRRTRFWPRCTADRSVARQAPYDDRRDLHQSLGQRQPRRGKCRCGTVLMKAQIHVVEPQLFHFHAGVDSVLLEQTTAAQHDVQAVALHQSPPVFHSGNRLRLAVLRYVQVKAVGAARKRWAARSEAGASYDAFPVRPADRRRDSRRR